MSETFVLVTVDRSTTPILVRKSDLDLLTCEYDVQVSGSYEDLAKVIEGIEEEKK